MNAFGGDVELRRLLDRRAIHDVVLRYCRGIDRMDLDAVRECYHPDATDEHGSFSGNVDEYLAWIGRLLPRYTSTMHLTGNHLVDFHHDTPDVARSETYGMAFHRSADPSPRGNLVTGFRYIDDFARRDGAWRIARRVATTEWIKVDDVATQWPIPEGMRAGRRDRQDAVYAPFPPT
ncbi:nuclear transport factor 2 family protein [Streptomyces sp. SID3343]|uniref:nuclear transport factor 2 family protein n=1 Tax=Streptomyces sp. SID3343 TaxID=2690260 RepID=UPI00136A8666|nr:nuclear transport factor 2 family protein [Streptomyces sp. SID3343]MYW06636.1 nuclear transport factor 2 family protein [Streptomyces sp. SID3343]